MVCERRENFSRKSPYSSKLERREVWGSPIDGRTLTRRGDKGRRFHGLGGTDKLVSKFLTDRVLHCRFARLLAQIPESINCSRRLTPPKNIMAALVEGLDELR